MTYTIQIISYDESKTFTVHGPGTGDRGIHLLQDPKGLIDAPLQSNWRESVYGVGAKPTGVTYPPRDLHLIFAARNYESPEQLRATESDFRMAWSELYDSTIRIITEDGVFDLKGRLLEAPIVDNVVDPALNVGVKIKYSIRCGNPNFIGEPEIIDWHFDGRNFYDEIVVSNPTDLPLWPQWVIPGPASMVLPDKDFANNVDRWVTLPYQFKGQNVLVDSRPDVEEVVCAGHAMWLGMMPDHFLNPIPPQTYNATLPVVVNPYPFADDIMKSLGLPTRLPHLFIVQSAKALTGQMMQIPEPDVSAMDVPTLAGKIEAAAQVAAQAIGDTVTSIAAKITAETVGRLLQSTYETVPAMGDKTVRLILPYEYSRPWGYGRGVRAE
ncbi:MAG: hypothetical protein WAN89_02730 [Lawsonella sp.]